VTSRHGWFLEICWTISELFWPNFGYYFGIFSNLFGQTFDGKKEIGGEVSWHKEQDGLDGDSYQELSLYEEKR